MRYAIPVSRGEFCSHFGQCEQFALIDVDPDSRQIRQQQLIDSPGHRPGFLPRWLVEQGAEVVLAGGIGQRAVDIFNHHKVKVVLGVAERDPVKAVLASLDGSLALSDNQCRHDGNHVCEQ